nr:hypothetical protein [uncultured Cellulosilyticum sp.]
MTRLKLLGGVVGFVLMSVVAMANVALEEHGKVNISKMDEKEEDDEAYQVNENGETYGTNNPELGYEPDLMAAIGENGVYGYVRSEDLAGIDFKTPEEAIEWQNSRPGVREIPVYDQEGEEVIDTFRISE